MKKLIDYKTSDGIKCGILEINMHKKKWILFGIYRPPTQNANFFFEEMGKAIYHYSNRSETFIVLGDIEEKQEEIKTFMEIYQLKNHGDRNCIYNLQFSCFHLSVFTIT